MADDLLQKALKTEESEFGARPDVMADLYQALGTNKDEGFGPTAFYYAEIGHLGGYKSLTAEDATQTAREKIDEIQRRVTFSEECNIPQQMIIIDYFEKSTAIRRTLEGDRHKTEIGNMLNRIAFYYAEIGDLGGYESLTADEATQTAREKVDEAISLFTELGDEAKTADCLITKGITCGRGDSQQIKCYKDAEQVLLRTVGEIHHTMTRVSINCGVYYEDTRRYKEAFDYYYKYYLLMVQLYGETHPKVFRAVETLNEPFYKRICKHKGVQIPEIASTQGKGDV